MDGNLMNCLRNIIRKKFSERLIELTQIIRQIKLYHETILLDLIFVS
jgi:hypothetical protein